MRPIIRCALSVARIELIYCVDGASAQCLINLDQQLKDYGCLRFGASTVGKAFGNVDG